MSKRLLALSNVLLAVALFARSARALDAVGPLPQGYWTTLLYLGENFETDDLADAGINHDYLASYGGEANQRPVDGLAYTNLAVSGTTTTGTTLTWTAMEDADGFWQPSNRNYYVKYWHVYVKVPGNSAREVRFWIRHDDEIRIWNNGALIVSIDGWDGGGEHTADAVLQPGINSLTIKLREGSGGDYMAVRVTDRSGNYFDDLSYQLTPDEFKIVNPITGSDEFIGTNAVGIAAFPQVVDGTAYQITLSDDPASLDPDEWVAYECEMIPAELVDFPQPAADTNITLHAWIRTSGASVATNHYESTTLFYTSVAPVAIARDAALNIDPDRPYVIDPSEIDGGSYDTVSGIHAMWVEPGSIAFAPTNVTLYVQNKAGFIASDPSAITPGFWCTFDVDGADKGVGSLDASFSGAAYGSPAATASVDCSWDFGDGSAAAAGTGLFDVQHAYATPGRYTVILTATSALGDVYAHTNANCVSVLGGALYADASAGAGRYPYAQPADASADLAAVVAAAQEASSNGIAGVTVNVAPGTYEIATQLDLSEPITILGTDGPETTRVKQTVDHLRVFTVSTNAVVGGLTVEGKYVNDHIRLSGGMFMSAGLATNVVITGCRGGGHANGGLFGAAAYLTGSAELVDSVVVSNRDRYNASPVYVDANAVVDRCEIFGNYGNAQHFSGDGGGGARINGGTVRNCYIHDNQSEYQPGGGVRIFSGLLENCTIVDNTVGASGGGGVNQTGGTVRNCIISGNKTAQGAATDYTGNGEATYSCAPELVSGTGNTSLDPLFADAANADFRLSSSSPCVDAGTAIDPDVTVDFARAARVVDGDGDGVPAIDMGCLEYVRDPSVFDCSFVATSPTKGLGSLEASFRGRIYGPEGATNSVTCTWDFGDGSAEVAGNNLFEVAHEYTTPGLFTVTFSVENPQGDTAEFVRPGIISMLADHVYVSTNGAAAFPYATPATATPDLDEACKVIVQAFDCGATNAAIGIGPGEFTIASEIALSRPIAVAGAGCGLTTVRQTTVDQRVFVLTDPSAFVCDLTVHGAYTPYNRWGGGVYLGAGMASNIVVTGCHGGGHGIGALVGSVYLGGTGTLVDSLVVSNRYDYNGGAIWIESNSALVDRCEIAWNRGSMLHHSGDGGAGARINGGTVRNCLIHHNASIYHFGGGVRIYGGMLENCTVADNSVEQNGYSFGGGVFHQGGTVRNCIVARNSCLDGPEDYVMHYERDVSNTCSPYPNKRIDTGTGLGEETVFANGENGNITAAPIFRDAENGDYRIRTASPTVGAGLNADWMDDALDFAGGPRRLGFKVDMGCYEAVPPGTILLVR
jgi:PKD repeat protein